MECPSTRYSGSIGINTICLHNSGRQWSASWDREAICCVPSWRDSSEWIKRSRRLLYLWSLLDLEVLASKGKKICVFFQTWARGCSMRPMARTSQAAAVCDEERKVCTHQGGWRRQEKGRSWRGFDHILQLLKNLKLWTIEIVDK